MGAALSATPGGADVWAAGAVVSRERRTRAPLGSAAAGEGSVRAAPPLAGGFAGAPGRLAPPRCSLDDAGSETWVGGFSEGVGARPT
jgi:hypothetical protein